MNLNSHFRKLLAACFCYLVSMPAFSQDTFWDDNANTAWYTGKSNSYTISTATDLAGLAILVNGGNTFSSDTIKLGADIDLSAHKWVPIGTGWDLVFKGCFDGKGYKIKGLKIDGSKNQGYRWFGFFSSISAVAGDSIVIKNILFSSENESKIEVESESSAPVDFIGTLIGYTNNRGGKILIEQCENEINVSGGKGTDSSISGGLIGLVASNTENGISIINCSNSGNITGSTFSEMSYTGGLIGNCSYLEKSGTMTRLINCHNNGNVTGGGTIWSYTGGVIGTNEAANLYRCSNQGNVTSGANASSTGGLIGNYTCMNETDISDCYNSGNVIGGGNSPTALNYVGGLIGTAYNNKELDFRTVNIISCYNSGNVSRRSETATSNIGGLIGLNFNVNISNCFVAAMAIESLDNDNVGRFIGNNIGNVPSIDNYAYVENMFSDNNDFINGLDWTGLMTSAPVNLWDPDVWIIDPTSQVLPKLRADDPDIPNPKYDETSNEVLGFEGVSVYATPGFAVISYTGDLQLSSDISVYSYDGSLLAKQRIKTGTTTIPLQKGLYIIVVNNKFYKISVRN